MSERSATGRGLRAAGSVAAAVVAGYGAERLTVARWRRGPDPCRDEPRSVPGHEHVVEGADGTALHAVVSGDGPTVILAHGYTATSHHWAPVAARLVERGLRVVVYDQRGHGRSSAGDGRFGTDQLADDLRAVVEALAGDQGAVLAGHSMGGIGVQAGLARHPELQARVNGIVLISTLARPVPVPLGRLMSRLGGSALTRKAMAHRIHGRILARGGLGRQPALTAIDVVRHGWANCPDSTRAGVMRDLRHYDFSSTLAGLHRPVTVMCGDRDQVTPLAESRRMADLLPDGRLEVAIGCGHALPWEAADRVAEITAAHALGPDPDVHRSHTGAP